MLGMKNYEPAYVDACRARVDADLAAYRKLVAAARKQAASGKAPLDGAIVAFDARFFNDLVLLLDACFVHRLRNIEGKDGNALNEVRVLCDSLLNNGGVMRADRAIKLSPDASVLHLRPGDAIRLDEGRFVALSRAFFAEIERKYT